MEYRRDAGEMAYRIERYRACRAYAIKETFGRKLKPKFNPDHDEVRAAMNLFSMWGGTITKTKAKWEEEWRNE